MKFVLESFLLGAASPCGDKLAIRAEAKRPTVTIRVGV